MGWAWCVPCISMFYMYLLPQKTVDFETSCLYCVGYVFFKTRNRALFLTSNVLCKLLQCPEISWWSFSVLSYKCIKNYLKINLFILIRYFIHVSYCFWDTRWRIIWATCQGIYSVIVLVVFTERQHVGLNTSIKHAWEFAI